LDLPLMDLYGTSECSGLQTGAVPSAFKGGWAGRSLPGCEIKLLHAAGRDAVGDGEVRPG